MTITANVHKGGVPQFSPHAPEALGLRPLYFTEREDALLLEKNIRRGFGQVVAGTILSKLADGEVFPYPGSNHLSTTAIGRAFALADLADAQTYIDVPIAKAQHFKVGDHVFLVRNNGGSPAYLDGGAITAINLAQTSVAARITFTNAVSGANFTVANSTNVYLFAEGSTTGGLKAKYICDKPVFTGEDATGLGAITPVCVSNAILYKGVIPNLDAAAMTDLGIVDEDPLLILK